MKLYMWAVKAGYHGFEVGYRGKVVFWILAEKLGVARRKAIEEIQKSTYPRKFKSDLLKIVSEEAPLIYKDGDTGMFYGE